MFEMSRLIVTCTIRSVASQFIISKVKSLRSNIHRKLHPVDVSGIRVFESYAINNYIIASKSNYDYLHQNKPPRKRLIISWSIVYILWAFTLELAVLAYANDPALLAAVGLPFTFLPNIQIVISTFVALAGFAAFSRMITLIMEKQFKIEVICMAQSILDDRKKGDLRMKYYLKMARLVEFSCDTSLRMFTLLEFVFIFVFLFSLIYSYLSPDIIFSYTMIIGCFFYPFIFWLGVSIYAIGFNAFFLSVNYLIYRFRQVFGRINAYNRAVSMNSPIAVTVLMLAIHEHNNLCRMNERNNHLIRLIMFELYYVGSLMFDLVLVLAFYLDNNFLIVRILFVAISCFGMCLYLMAYSAASLEKASHSLYPRLNAIMAYSAVVPTQLHIDDKLKINNLLERLAQTQITVWCLDLFTINNYELYLFTSAIISNFMLVTGLIKPS